MAAYDDLKAATMRVMAPGAALPLTTSAPRADGTPEDIARAVIEGNPAPTAEMSAPVKLGPNGLQLPGVTPADHSVRGHVSEELKTFGGEKLSRFTGPGGIATDGVMSMITGAAFKKSYFETRWTSPGYNAIAAYLSFWTTRTWTHNIGSAGTYLKGFYNWLNLDWMGRTVLENSRLRIFASGKAVAGFDKSSEQGAGKEAPE